MTGRRLWVVLGRYARRFAEVRLGTPASIVFGLGAAGRGSSYIARPPDEVATVEGLVAGGWIPYPAWGWVLLVAGTTAAVLTILEPDPEHRRRTSEHRFTPIELGAVHTVGISHTLLLGCYLTLAVSGTFSAVLNGLPWSGVAGFAMGAGLHAKRIDECFDVVAKAHTRRRLERLHQKG